MEQYLRKVFEKKQEKKQTIRVCLIMFILSIIISFVTNCTTTYRVKIDTTKDINYIEPQQCQIREINKINYKTTIKNDSIMISNQDMGAFLANLIDYKQAVEEYKMCNDANEEYYKNIINTLIDNKIIKKKL